LRGEGEPEKPALTLACGFRSNVEKGSRQQIAVLENPYEPSPAFSMSVGPSMPAVTRAS
jgi:hypothetical protein